MDQVPTPELVEEPLESVKPNLVSTGEVLLRVMQADNRSIQHLLGEDFGKASKGRSSFLFGGLAALSLLAAGPVLLGLYTSVKGWLDKPKADLDELETDADETEALGLTEAALVKDEKEATDPASIKKTFGDLAGKQTGKPAAVKASVAKAVKADLATPNADVDLALRAVAAKTGVDYHTLYALAGTESSFRKDVKAGTSSGLGIGQFLAGTWKYLTETRFPELGYTPEDRTDPYKAATVMALYLTEIKAKLIKALGREPSLGDKYLAYFLGPTGAIRFLRALKKNPKASAASLFPSAAKANPNLFYFGKKALSLQDTYGKLTGKINTYHAASFENASSSIAALSAPSASREGSYGRDEASLSDSKKAAPATVASRPPTESIAKQGAATAKARAAPMTLTPTEPKPRPVSPESDDTVAQAGAQDSGPMVLPAGRAKPSRAPDFVRTRSGLLLSVPG